MSEKKVNKAWLPIAVVFGLLALGFMGHDLFEKPETVIPEGYVSQATLSASITNAKNEVISLANKELANRSALIADLQSQLAEKQVVEEEKSLLGYLIDELFLSVPLVEDIFSDREVSTLFDGEVRFDGDDYDAEETITLKDIELLANERDFEGNVYMTVPEEAVEYTLTFDSELDTSLIDEDETLEFNFLGEAYEVSNWDVSEITLAKGKKTKLLIGESITVGDKVITLDGTNDDSKVSVMVGDETEVISEGSTKTVNGIEIRVDSVFHPTYAVLIVAEEIETTIESGDEYEEDSAWEWVIDANSIGLVLVEDHTEVDLDGDEEFQAVGVDEKLCLPNEYKCIVFNGMDKEDKEEYYLELDEKSGVDYVRIEGNFVSGLKDYDRVYVDVSDSKVYDRDLEEITGTIELGDTDSILEVGSDLVFEDLTINFALDTANVNGDEDYLTDYGILVINPEDAVEDNEFNIFIPEKQLEGSISLQ
jgi:hypothetical protein